MSTYPINTTGQQFHFDADGTIGQYLQSNRSFQSAFSQATLGNLTSWQTGTAYVAAATLQSINFFFPQPRDLVAISMSIHTGSGYGLPVLNISYNTTDGMNGTWTTVRTTAELLKWNAISSQALRAVEPFVYNGVRGIETISSGYSHGIQALNLFGSYAPVGLRFWHATEDREMDGDNLDLGDLVRSNAYTRQFRIKNLNSLTANNVLVAASAPNAGSTLAGMEFSDGGAYATSQTISSIAPGAISSIITARRTVAPNATENQTGNCRVTATEGSWS
jgi:hypothetical protein